MMTEKEQILKAIDNTIYWLKNQIKTPACDRCGHMYSLEERKTFCFPCIEKREWNKKTIQKWEKRKKEILEEK